MPPVAMVCGPDVPRARHRCGPPRCRRTEGLAAAAGALTGAGWIGRMPPPGTVLLKGLVALVMFVVLAIMQLCDLPVRDCGVSDTSLSHTVNRAIRRLLRCCKATLHDVSQDGTPAGGTHMCSHQRCNGLGVRCGNDGRKRLLRQGHHFCFPVPGVSRTERIDGFCHGNPPFRPTHTTPVNQRLGFSTGQRRPMRGCVTARPAPCVRRRRHARRLPDAAGGGRGLWAPGRS